MKKYFQSFVLTLFSACRSFDIDFVLQSIIKKNWRLGFIKASHFSIILPGILYFGHGYTQNYSISTIAGTGSSGSSGDGLLAVAAQLNSPYGVAVDDSGNVYIADQHNHCIRKIVAGSGIIIYIAGNGSDGVSQLNYPTGVALDASKNLYIADYLNNCIKLFTVATGVISTIAGNGQSGFSKDGSPAISSQLNYPSGVAIDGIGNVYFSEQLSHRIRRISVSTGIITDIAGIGSEGYSRDEAVAAKTQLSFPFGVAVDATGNVFIADTGNHRICKVVAAMGAISTIAGIGSSGYNGNGLVATQAQLNCPVSVALDASGNVYIADMGNSCIRKINTQSGIITTIAGTGIAGYNGDGPNATVAQLNFPTSIAVDASGNVYIADNKNNLVRKLTPRAN